MTETMRIDAIRIGERARQNMGDIEGLAASIEEVGLLEPIAVTRNGLLVAGQRRLEAFQLLGRSEIPVYFVDNLETARDLLVAEADENVKRENWTPLEAINHGLQLEPIEKALAEQRRIDAHASPENFSELDKGRALDHVAAVVGMSRPTYTKAREVVQSGRTDLVERMHKTRKVDSAYQELKRDQLLDELLARRKAESGERWSIEVGDVATYQSDRRFDFIITDPPYPREYLPLYGILARRAKEWLAPAGLLVVMCGQSYLDEIYRMMGEHLTYYWTACYLTPGQPKPLRQRQVNTSWKPILIYALNDQYNGKTFGDVFTSDANDKDFHKWGQSVSGMLSLITQLCLPGQSIFDPFCGAGTTGLAAIQYGCTFHGIDIDGESVKIAQARLGTCNDKAKE